MKKLSSYKKLKFEAKFATAAVWIMKAKDELKEGKFDDFLLSMKKTNGLLKEANDIVENKIQKQASRNKKKTKSNT